MHPTANQTSTPPRLRTIEQVARELRVSRYRVRHIVRSRGHIRPVALAGRLRIFDRAAVARIRHEINKIDARRSASASNRT